MKFEYQGYVLEILREGEHCYSTECNEPNLKLFNTLRANITLENLISQFKEEVDILLAKKEEKQMKKLTVEYKNYQLVLEIHTTITDDGYPYTKGICNSISFVKSGYYEDCQPIIYSFMKNVDYLTANKVENLSSTILQQYNLQLERLALKDKKDKFSPLELRRQLVEIYVLFNGILDKTLEDVKKDYCEIYPTVKSDYLFSLITSDKD